MKIVNSLKPLPIFAKRLRHRYASKLQTQVPLLPYVDCRSVPPALLIRESMKLFFVEFFMVFFYAILNLYFFVHSGPKGPKMNKFGENFFCASFNSLGYLLLKTIVGSSKTLSKCVFNRPVYKDPVFYSSKRKNPLFIKLIYCSQLTDRVLCYFHNPLTPGVH